MPVPSFEELLSQIRSQAERESETQAIIERGKLYGQAGQTIANFLGTRYGAEKEPRTITSVLDEQGNIRQLPKPVTFGKGVSIIERLLGGKTAEETQIPYQMNVPYMERIQKPQQFQYIHLPKRPLVEVEVPGRFNEIDIQRLMSELRVLRGAGRGDYTEEELRELAIRKLREMSTTEMQQFIGPIRGEPFIGSIGGEPFIDSLEVIKEPLPPEFEEVERFRPETRYKSLIEPGEIPLTAKEASEFSTELALEKGKYRSSTEKILSSVFTDMEDPIYKEPGVHPNMTFSQYRNLKIGKPKTDEQIEREAYLRGKGYAAATTPFREAESFKRSLARIRNEFQNDPLAKKLIEKNVYLNEMNSIMEEVRKGNTVAISGLGVKMARAMGEVGVLTEQDVVRYVQSPQLVRKWSDIIKRGVWGKLSTETTNEIDEMVGLLQGVAKEKIIPIFERHAHTLAKETGITFDEAMDYIGSPEKVAKSVTGVVGKKPDFPTGVSKKVIREGKTASGNAFRVEEIK